MTDEQGDGKTTRREPGIRIDDPDRDKGFSSTDDFYSGDLFDRPDQESGFAPPPDDDFDLNRFSDTVDAADDARREDEEDDSVEEWNDEPDNGPIIPDRDEIRIPPAAPVTPAAGQSKKGSQGGGLSIATILAAAALLASVYAIWLGGGQSDRIAQLETNERPKIEDMDKLQNQDINALANKLSAVEKEQQKLAAMKAGLESMIAKQAEKNRSDLAGLESRVQKQEEKHKADLVALMQRESNNHKAMMEKLAVQKPASSKPGSTPAQPVQKAPVAAKPKTSTQKPVIDDSELPGPIESASEAQAAGSSAADRQSSWGVNLMSVESEAAATKEIERLRGLGIQAESIAITVGGRQMHRIRVAGFASKQEALDMQARLARENGLKGTWVNNQ